MNLTIKPTNFATKLTKNICPYKIHTQMFITIFITSIIKIKDSNIFFWRRYTQTLTYFYNGILLSDIKGTINKYNYIEASYFCFLLFL